MLVNVAFGKLHYFNFAENVFTIFAGSFIVHSRDGVLIQKKFLHESKSWKCIKLDNKD